MSASTFPNFNEQNLLEDSAEPLVVALIGPNEQKRGVVAEGLDQCLPARVFESHSYPPDSDNFRALLAQPIDLIMLELDSDLTFALNLIEIASTGAKAIVVYSEMEDLKLARHCFALGACDYLPLPFDKSDMADALKRGIEAQRAHSKRTQSNVPPKSEINHHPASNNLPRAMSSALPATLPADFSDWDGDETSPSPHPQSQVANDLPFCESLQTRHEFSGLRRAQTLHETAFPVPVLLSM